MLVRVTEDRGGWWYANPASAKMEYRLRKERGDYDIKDNRRRRLQLDDAFIFVQMEAEQAAFLPGIAPTRRKELRQWGIAVRMDEETVRAFAGMEPLCI